MYGTLFFEICQFLNIIVLYYILIIFNENHFLLSFEIILMTILATPWNNYKSSDLITLSGVYLLEFPSETLSDRARRFCFCVPRSEQLPWDAWAIWSGHLVTWVTSVFYSPFECRKFWTSCSASLIVPCLSHTVVPVCIVLQKRRFPNMIKRDAVGFLVRQCRFLRS